MYNSPIKNKTLIEEAYEKGYRDGLNEDTEPYPLRPQTQSNQPNQSNWNSYRGGIGNEQPRGGGGYGGNRGAPGGNQLRTHVYGSIESWMEARGWGSQLARANEQGSSFQWGEPWNSCGAGCWYLGDDAMIAQIQWEPQGWVVVSAPDYIS